MSSPTEKKILTNRADVASLMLAAADDQQALLMFVADLEPTEAGELLSCALVMGGTLVRVGDRAAAAGQPQTPRDLLAAVLDTCRGELDRHSRDGGAPD